MLKQSRRLIILGGVIFILLLLVMLTALPAINPPTAFYRPGGGDAQQGQGQIVSADAVQPVAQKRIVIQNASLDLVVQDTAATLAAITDLTNKIGGWVVTSNNHQNANRVGNELIYRTSNIRCPGE